jgi:hypothetical protein
MRKRGMRAVTVALIITRAGASRRRSGTRPPYRRHFSPVIPSVSFSGKQLTPRRPRPGRGKLWSIPTNLHNTRHSRGCHLPGSARGGSRAAGIITASISDAIYVCWSIDDVSVPRTFPRRAAVVVGRLGGYALDGPLHFVLRRQAAQKLKWNKLICLPPRLFRLP